MYDGKRLKRLQNSQDIFFTAVEKFITYYNSEIDGDNYLTFIENINDIITLKVGVEKFTIRSQIYLNDNRIIFKIYAWIFDITKIDRYGYEPINELDFYADDSGGVRFISEKINPKTGNKYIKIISFRDSNYYKDFTLFFEELEAYTDKRLIDMIKIN